MENESRGIVLPFRNGTRVAVPPPASPPHVVASCREREPRLYEADDREINAEWDLLIRLATQAWSWRDPDSLDVLEDTLARLRTWIGHDWSS
jgi:hypothetical protein